MHVDRCKSKQNGKIYKSVLLRNTYRDEKGKIRHKTVLNLSNYPEEEITAIEWALKHKKDLPNILDNTTQRKTGKSLGSVYLVNEIIKKLHIDKALGKTLDGELAKFQIISRTLNQGSCLSSIRLATEHQAICETLSIEDSIYEDKLYKNLEWLCKNQRTIESKLFKYRYKDNKPEIFLYDVTSSYLEGIHNALGNWGYNRDKKKGKMQIVAGLLCDEQGYPIVIRLFKGNTLDFNTVTDQIKEISKNFGCERVTFVGDRGMIKSKQIAELNREDFYYITAITKPQIELLLKENIFQMNLFDEDVQEVYYDKVRYILKRNPVRAKELSKNREQKKDKIQDICRKQNEYLKEHNRSKLATAIKTINNKIKKLKIENWLSVEISKDNDRELMIQENLLQLSEMNKLDGCYVIKSNLPEEVSKESIHDRYKDLKYVEEGFRTMKTDYLEIRPWYVRSESSTRGHAFVTMMSYMVVKYLKELWKTLNITVEEGLKILDSLCMLEVKINGEIKYYEIPEPSEIMKKLLKLAGITIPDILPYKKANVYSRKKLVRIA